MQKILSEILPAKGTMVIGDQEVLVSGISFDSRKISPGDIFVAIKGANCDGREFIDSAIAAGASAILASRTIENCPKTVIVAENVDSAMSEISARLFDHPDRKMFIIGVTGTNGKTTTTYFLESIFKKIGKKCGVIGTVNYRFADKVLPAPNTTPLSAEIYSMLNAMREEGVEVAVMEVSSHALALGRVEGIEFDRAIFTNLTGDHLDFHKTMEKYFEAKEILFTGLKKGEKNFMKKAIINIDDPWGRKLGASQISAEILSYGINGAADINAKNVSLSPKGSKFDLFAPDGKISIDMSHLGMHNVYNALSSVACAVSMGINLCDIKAGVEMLKGVPGRLEKIESNSDFTVVVDFAHTHDALKNVLNAIKGLKPSKIITVFGCGGNRDKTKRPLMGAVAVELSDHVIVTSDNPRNEDPKEIIKDIEAGIDEKFSRSYEVVLERERAVERAVSIARKGDVVLLAGKGHENYQIIKDKKIHYNDAETAEKYIKLLKETPGKN